MANWRCAVRRLCVAAGGLLLIASAFSFSFLDGDIKILRNAGSPTLAVQYSGAKAARVEIRINGKKAGSKEVNAAKSSGIVSFGIKLEELQAGNNVLEAFLFDGKGAQVGYEKATITAEKGPQQPVFIRLPKMAQTVSGSVEIQVGFGVDMRETYVSFFVDGQFRSMKNFPPYSYIWDTTAETNGWHEVEAWTFDATQTTRKSQAVRVMVNNPGGRTERLPATPEAKPGPEPIKPAAAPLLADPKVAPPLAKQSDLRGPVATYETVSGYRVSTPRAGKIAEPLAMSGPAIKPPMAGAAPGTAAGVPSAGANAADAKAPRTVTITAGAKLPISGKFSIYLNGEEIRFDVSPRVADGIPLTPFRHLFEGAGGIVDWDNAEKVCTASGPGSEVWIKIGDLFAKVNGKAFQLEAVPFIESGRTIVPLSFVNDALGLDVQFDPKSGHVLITQRESK